MRKYIGLFVLSIFMLFLLFTFEKQTIEKGTKEDALQEQGPYEVKHELFYAMVQKDGNPFVIEAWEEKENHYVLFLPFCFQDEEELRVYTSEDIEVENAEALEGNSIIMNKESVEFRREGVPGELRVMFSSDIPVLWINTANEDLEKINGSKEHEEKVTVNIWNQGSGAEISEGKMHARGNVSFDLAPKKSYLLEMDEDTDFFGMGEARKWVLTSNYFDQTLLRNYFTVQLAQKMGMSFVPEACFADLYVDGHYIGNYLIGEKVEVGRQRVNIRDLETENINKNGFELLKRYPFYDDDQKGFKAKSPKDITGGYLVEFELEERWPEENSGFITEDGQPVIIQSPKHATVDEVRYIAGLFQKLENTILDEKDSDGYLDYIDLDSFANKYLLEELCKNIDANKTSQFFYKYDDSISSKIFAGPIWDYDKAWGNGGKLDEGLDLREPEGFYVKKHVYPHSIWTNLYQKDSFRNCVAKKYCTEVLPIMNELAEQELDKWKEKYKASFMMDWTRWNHEREEEKNNTEQRYRNSYEEAFEEMKDFAIKRADFLLSEWNY